MSLNIKLVDEYIGEKSLKSWDRQKFLNWDTKT